MSASSALSIIASQYDSFANRSEIIAFAELNVNRCWFGDKADYAVAYMAAHLITLIDRAQGGNAEGGNITNKKEGDLSISFGTLGGFANAGALNLTVYGQQFQALQNGSNVILGVTGGGLDGIC